MSTLNHCTLTGNSAANSGGNRNDGGGGAFSSTLNHCTLTGNRATNGGGAFGGRLTNCIAFYNTASSNANYNGGNLSFCCTTPLPTNGTGNITTPPGFVDAAAGNLRLLATSPCINAGNNALVVGDRDLDGRPRITGGTVDMGAYEFPNPASQISYAWLQSYGFPTDGSADFTDPDADGLNNWQEWTADTQPNNPASALKITAVTHGPAGTRVAFASSNHRHYTLHSAANPGGPWAPVPGATAVTGTGGSQTLNDPTPGSTHFYRVEVQVP